MSIEEYLISIGVYALIMFSSILLASKETTNIVDVIDIVGDYCCAGIGFVLPPIIFLCTFNYKEYSTCTLMTVILVLCFGVFFWTFETINCVRKYLM